MGVGVYGGVGWRLKAEKERLLRQTSDRSDRADDEDVMLLLMIMMVMLLLLMTMTMLNSNFGSRKNTPWVLTKTGKRR
ncbi:hypothetical protein Hdeb2414_s0123g00803961 [Helianthus debilis subsp. tardiflorus]